MPQLTQKSTFFEKNIDQNSKAWHIIDAKGQTLGRLATTVADLLRGKHKVTFTPHVDSGDFVVVVNAAQVRLTGNKLEDKLYYDHSGFVGGLKIKSAGDWLKRRPEELVERAVWGMIPKGKLGRHQITKLKVYAGAEHPHSAQNPKPWQAPQRKKIAAKKSQ